MSMAIAALAIVRTHHFQALWYETSALGEMGLVLVRSNAAFAWFMAPVARRCGAVAY